MTVTAERFSLRLPPTWFEFDVWRAVRTGDLRRIVDERLTRVPDLVPHRTTILKALRKVAEDADRRGAVYCAACADEIDDEGHVFATLMVFSTDGTGEPLLNTVEVIAAQVASVAPAEGSPAWRQVRIVDLPAGRAVVVRGVSELGDPGAGQTVPIVSMQVLVPIPGSDAVLDLAFTSPNVGLAEPLLDLFDAVAQTLTWERGPSPA